MSHHVTGRQFRSTVLVSRWDEGQVRDFLKHKRDTTRDLLTHGHSRIKSTFAVSVRALPKLAQTDLTV